MAAIKVNNLIYGTVEECVREIVEMIDWNRMSIPNFDFCSSPYGDITIEDLESASDGCDLGECWYGCKNVASEFNAERDCLMLLFGHWGGYGSAFAEFLYDERHMIIQTICEMIHDVTFDELMPDDMTVFEIMG